ncbi:hypothetical protein G6F57_019135 [Rhizopus arrhizus]|nr:hypothetical protein G6F57_019135 [Rhizopus arrhizus]
MGIQHAVDDQVAHGRKTDAAHLRAAGIDAAIDGQAAAVHHQFDVPGPQLVTDHHVATLDLETPGAEDTPSGQARIQVGKVGQGLRPQHGFGAFVRHPRAARGVPAGGRAAERAAQVHPARFRAQRDGLNAAGAVVLRRHVDKPSPRLPSAPRGPTHRSANPRPARCRPRP